MKDRSGLSGYVVALEGLVAALARRQVATMDAAERAQFAKDAAACVDRAGTELVESAALIRGKLSPDAAKVAAQRIKDDANHILGALLGELMPSAADEKK